MTNATTITILLPAPLPKVPPWVQAVQAIIAILIFFAVLRLNPDFRAWVSQLKGMDWLTPVARDLPSQAPSDVSYLFFLHGAQAFLISCFLFVHHRELEALKKKMNDSGLIAQKTLQQFAFNWKFMWSTWAVLYLWYTVMNRLGAWPELNAQLDPVIDVLRVTSGFAIWTCFLVLRYPSVNTRDKPARGRPYYGRLLIAVVIGIVIAGVNGIVCAYLGPARFYGWWNLGLVAIGVYMGLAVASLGGQLEDHRINMPLWQLLSLYAYGMLQLCSPFLEFIEPKLILVYFSSALVGKWILFSIGSNIFRYGGLERYLRAAEQGLLVVEPALPGQSQVQLSEVAVNAGRDCANIRATQTLEKLLSAPGMAEVVANQTNLVKDDDLQAKLQRLEDFDEELAERLLSEAMDRLAIVARDVSDLAAETAIDLALIETKRIQIDRAQAENSALLRELTEQAQ